MKKALLTLILSAGMLGAAQAQLYNSTSFINDAGNFTDYSVGWTNTATGSYTGINGGTFSHYGPAAGTFTNNGAYTSGAGGMTDNFSGPNGAAGAQEIAGTTAPAFYNLVLNNGSSAAINVTNSSGIVVTNSLTFSNGITTTVRAAANTGAVKLAAGSGYTGTMSATRQVNGYVSKTGNTAFTFPAGDGMQYRPLAYTTPPSASTAQLSVAYVTGDPGVAGNDPTGGAHSRSSISSSGTAGVNKIASVSPIGFWDWVPVSGTSGITFTVSIPDMSGNGGYATAAGMRVVGWNTGTSQWENLSGSTGASSNAAGTLMTGTVSNMSLYSAIGIGSVIAAAPLPIRLLSFGGKAAGCAVVLSWQTTLEAGAEYFAVERSADAIQWQEIRRVAATNSGEALLSYQATDEAPARTANYYRLRMAERDGQSSFSNVAAVTPDCGQQPGIVISPNPFTESLRVDGMVPGTSITVSGMDGRVVYSGMADATAVIPATAWATGAYLVRVMRGSKEVSVQQVVKK